MLEYNPVSILLRALDAVEKPQPGRIETPQHAERDFAGLIILGNAVNHLERRPREWQPGVEIAVRKGLVRS